MKILAWFLDKLVEGGKSFYRKGKKKHISLLDIQVAGGAERGRVSNSYLQEVERLCVVVFFLQNVACM